MAGIVFYILDLETTGLSKLRHEIIEISVIRVSDRCQINRQVRADRPNDASFDALKITGKTIDDLYIGISKKQMIADIEEFFNQDGLTPAHRCIVGHNIIGFDKNFLHYAWDKADKQFPAELWFDTLSMCRKVAKDMGLVRPRLNLHSVCDMFGIKKIATAHNSKDDTKNNYMLFQYFIDKKIPYLELIKRIPHYKDE